MQADCSYMPTEHFAEPGVQLPKTPPVDNSSGMVPPHGGVSADLLEVFCSVCWAGLLLGHINGLASLLPVDALGRWQS